jgi:hypothetical protein
MARIRAARIQLIHRDARRIIQLLDHLKAVLDGEAKHIRNHHRAVQPVQLRKFLRDERPHSHILQPDRIDHPRSRLDDARRRIARHRLPRQPLGHKPADAIE